MNHWARAYPSNSENGLSESRYLFPRMLPLFLICLVLFFHVHFGRFISFFQSKYLRYIDLELLGVQLELLLLLLINRDGFTARKVILRCQLHKLAQVKRSNLSPQHWIYLDALESVQMLIDDLVDRQVVFH